MTSGFGNLLGVSARALLADLRDAFGVWLAAACSIDGETARDEAEILRNELSAELQSNAALQQRVTSFELAAAETAKLLSPSRVEAEETERLKGERELREGMA